MTQLTFEKATEVLRSNCVKEGLRASAAYYNQVWARDSFISFLGANLIEDEKLNSCAKANIKTFANAASPLGQIPNFYDLSTKRPEYGYSGSTDSSCWYIIGLASLYSATEDRELLKRPLDAAVGAYRWLRFQDANNTWLIDSPPGADWMDAAIQRTGKTLYNNVLFLIATDSLRRLTSISGSGSKADLMLDHDSLKRRFTDVFLPGPESPTRLAKYWPGHAATLAKGRLKGFARNYFLQYVSFYRMDARFDTFSNLLCILGGVSDRKTSLSILDFMRKENLSEPFPSRVLYPPYAFEGASYDKDFDSAVPTQHRSSPYEYHNGAVWPFVGGAYVSTLYQLGDDKAGSELESLARANAVLKEGERVGFNEWLHGRTGKALGQYGQSWNAGMYIAAVCASRGKNPLGFVRK